MKKICFLLALAVTLGSCSSTAKEVFNSLNGCSVIVSGYSNGKKPDKVEPGEMISHNFGISSNFTEVNTTGMFNVIITQDVNAKVNSVKANLPENLLDYLEVKTEGSTLVIRTKDKPLYMELKKNECPTFYISMKSVGAVKLAGSGDVNFSGPVEIGSSSLSLAVVGSGDLTAPAVTGTGGKVTLTVSGSGDLNVDKLKASQLSVKVAGSGDIRVKGVNVESCTANCVGSGDISLAGKASTANLTVVGSGDIHAKPLSVNHGSKSVTGTGDIDCSF